jgi:hypothetical protein
MQSSKPFVLAVYSVLHWCFPTSFYAFYFADLLYQAKALELPKEHEMLPKDKYTIFSPHAGGYRKGIHKVPKWTRVSSPPSAQQSRLTRVQLTLRINPEGF